MSVNEFLVRIGAMLAGVALLGCFLLSASRAALVNRHKGDWIAHGVGRAVCATMSRLAASQRDYDAVQDVLAWILPLYILSLIVTWFLLVQIGFTLILWASHVETGFLKAFLASGSALSTLGFLTPNSPGGQMLAILEGAMGLGVVVFFFTFIPGYQSAIQSRELKIAWLYARSGAGTSGYAFTEWQQRSGIDAGELWEAWEEWFRLLAETVAIAPVLSIVPTLHRRQSWLVAAAVVLDAASYCLATLDGDALVSASVCRLTGIEALELIAARLHSNRAFVKTIPFQPSSRATFDATFVQMGALKAPLRGDAEAAWGRYLALRQQYEGRLSELAAKLLVSTPDSALRLLQSPV